MHSSLHTPSAQLTIRHFTHHDSLSSFHTPIVKSSHFTHQRPVDNFSKLSSFHTPNFVISHTKLRHFTHRHSVKNYLFQGVICHFPRCNSIITLFNSLRAQSLQQNFNTQLSIQRILIESSTIGLALKIHILLGLKWVAVTHQQQQIIRLHARDLFSRHELLTLL